MLTFLNRHVAQPYFARRAKSRHLHYLRLLEQRQYDPPAAVAARQLAALKVQLTHAYATVPYYRRTWDAVGVNPADVKTLADLTAFPVLTKADIRAHESELLSTPYRCAKLRLKRTSGSTGVPLTIRVDEPAMQWKHACTIRSDQWSGYRLGQRVAKVWGNPEYLHHGWRGRLRNRLLDRAVYLDTIHLTDAKVAAFAAEVRRHRPGLIFGHAHSLYLVACHLKKTGVLDIRPNGIISTAMVLHDYQRKLIAEVFGTPVTNRYGCEEVSLIASECEAHAGLHVNADNVFVEARTGTPGPLVVTDLVNRAMPLIRYQIGDVAVGAGRACTCGRGLPLLDRIEGREADYVVTPAGTLVSGISLTENFALLIDGTAQVQIVQETIHDLRIRLVAGDGFGPASHTQIEKLVRDTFGPTVRFAVELVDAIPQEPSGKYRFCISKPARDHLQALSA
ncbi:phenylacetate--CoA ligase family protein [Urbifossiella limnaea]|uniref:Phenylacetate-coenzyme A ligase n=1 Tax=Urbifossiella limnaea TaxID=2528023 RepID=A0A517XRA8_9BACT|nr:phenylacetate--CoA ligase family protein [Urbifossiella limnaea]QDU20046.1 Phenylacetate-coenzyme A ligase [Urbifossiella limnaea]